MGMKINKEKIAVDSSPIILELSMLQQSPLFSDKT